MKAILFDVDGVLINGRFSDRLAKDYGITQEQVLPFFQGPFRDCQVGKADLKEELKPFLAEWNWEGNVEDFLAYWFESGYVIDEELIAFIKKTSVPCFLATNQEKYRDAYLRENLGFEELFDGIFSSVELGVKKPSHEFFEKILENLDVEKQEIAFWDDDKKIVAAAKDFGFDSYLYTGLNDFVEWAKRKDL